MRKTVKFSDCMVLNDLERYFDEDLGRVTSGRMCLAFRLVNTRDRSFVWPNFTLYLLKRGICFDSFLN